jgi:tRNA(fMet)-specific endonuclease VapC
VNQYLLDTNICIYFLKGQFNINEKIKKIGVENCFLSEMSIAEMKFGVENSDKKEENRKHLVKFQSLFGIIPIFPSLDIYAKEKSRLRKRGQIVDDFDLLIGATAIFNDLTLVTRNVKHFERLDKIKIEDWTKE